MQNANPYSTPKARVAGSQDTQYGEIRILTSRGRIGRLRYIGYTTGLPFLILVLVGAASALLLGSTASGPFEMVFVIAYIAVTIFVILLTIQRCHDMNKSGWMALLLIVPLINLIFWFGRGTDGENRFGLQPPPNGIGVVLLALAFPLLAILGIAAAIALPAYQQYLIKAGTTQSQ